MKNKLEEKSMLAMKIKEKVAQKSLRYLKRTADALEKLAKGEVEVDQLNTSFYCWIDRNLSTKITAVNRVDIM